MMIKITPTSLLLSFFLLSSSLAKPVSWHIQESRTSAPAGFSHVGPAPSDQLLTMSINLAQSNLAGLQSALDKAADPASSTFRQWLSTDEVNAYSAPTPETYNSVTQWLGSNGVKYENSTTSGDWLKVTVPVSQASTLFNAQFNVYKHEASGKESVRTLEYSLPAEVRGLVGAVHPTTSFSGPSRGPPVLALAPKPQPIISNGTTPSSDAVPASCSSAITPACLQALYSIPTTAASGNANGGIGVAGMDDQYANKVSPIAYACALNY